MNIWDVLFRGLKALLQKIFISTYIIPLRLMASSPSRTENEARIGICLVPWYGLWYLPKTLSTCVSNIGPVWIIMQTIKGVRLRCTESRADPLYSRIILWVRRQEKLWCGPHEPWIWIVLGNKRYVALGMVSLRRISWASRPLSALLTLTIQGFRASKYLNK